MFGFLVYLRVGKNVMCFRNDHVKLQYNCRIACLTNTDLIDNKLDSVSNTRKNVNV